MVSQSNDKSKAHIKRTAKKVAGKKELEEWKGATTNKKKTQNRKTNASGLAKVEILI